MSNLRISLAIATFLSLAISIAIYFFATTADGPFSQFLHECLALCGRKGLLLAETIAMTLIVNFWALLVLHDGKEMPPQESILRQLIRLGLASATAILAIALWYLLLESDHNLRTLEISAIVALSSVLLANAYCIFVTPFATEIYGRFSWSDFWARFLLSFFNNRS